MRRLVNGALGITAPQQGMVNQRAELRNTSLKGQRRSFACASGLCSIQRARNGKQSTPILRSDCPFHRDRRGLVVEVGADDDLLAQLARGTRLDAQVEDVRCGGAVRQWNGQAFLEPLDRLDAER